MGQLIPTDPIPYGPCTATEAEGELWGKLLLGDWLGIGRLLVRNCFLLQNLPFLVFIYHSLLFSYSLQCRIILFLLLNYSDLSP